MVRPTGATFALALALALALPIVASGQTRPPPPDAEGTGPFHKDGDRLVGSHVSFTIDRENGRLVDYTVDGRVLFDSIVVRPSAFRVETDRDPHALRLVGRGFFVALFDGPGGGIVFAGREDSLASLTFDPVHDIEVVADERRALALRDADGPVGFVLTPQGRMLGEGGSFTVIGEAAFRMVPLDQPLRPRPEVRDRIEGAFERGHLGAEIVVERPGRDGQVTAYDNLTVSVDAQEGRLRAVVSAPGMSGRILIFHVANAVLDDASLRVMLDGQEIVEAEDELDALDPDDDGLAPEWYALEGEAGVTVFLSLPHFSEWEIEIQSIQAVAARAFPILGAAGAIAVVVIAGALMVRGGRRDEL